MTLKSGPTGRFAGSSGLWIVVAALMFVIGTACTDQPETGDRRASLAPSDAPGANTNLAPSDVRAGNPMNAAEARADARSPDERRKRFAKMREDRYAELGLSDEQQQSIEALRAEQQAWRAENRDAVRALADKRRAARQAGDDAEAEAIRLQLLELRETLPTEQDIFALLTDEQRAQLRKNRPITVMGRPPERRSRPAPAADEAPEGS